MDYQKALTASVIIHFALFLPIFTVYQGGGNGLTESTSVEIIGKSDKTIKKEDNKPEEGTLVTKEVKNTPKEDKPCDKWYGGIGIIVTAAYSDGFLEVGEVAQGYPAAKAGISKGDRVKPIKKGETIAGEPGTEVAFILVSGSESLIMRLTRVRVCTTN